MKTLDEKELCLACIFNNGNGTCSNRYCKYQQVYKQGRADAIDLVSRHLWNYDHKVYHDFENLLEQIKEQKNE